MKKMYKLNQSLRLLFMVVFVGCFSTASAQLSGSYTINNGSATGGTNFNTFLDFSTTITSVGVSGPVTVTFVTNQTETGQIVFPAITNASSTNTITIDGSGKYVEYAVADAVILMNGGDYFTFKNLTVRNTSTSQYVQGFRFTNGSDYNTVDKCTIEFSALTTGTTGGGAYVSFASSATSLTSTSGTNNGANNTISNTLMRTTNSNSPGPAYAIAYTGSSSNYNTTAQNNTFSTNTIQNFYYTAFYLYYSNGVQILSNDISRANSTTANCNSTLIGINSTYSYAANRATKFDNNNMHDWPYSGAPASSSHSYTYAFNLNYNYGASNTTYRFSVTNNTLTNLKAYYGMYLGYHYYTYYGDVKGNIADNNDVYITSSSSQTFYGWQINYCLGYQFNNNVIRNCDGGYWWYGFRTYYPLNASGVESSISGNLIENNTQMYYMFYGVLANYVYNSSTSYLSMNDNTIKGTRSNYYYVLGISTYDLYYGYIGYGYFNIQRNKIMDNRSGSSVGYVYGIYVYYAYDLNVTDNLITDNVGYYGQYGMLLQSYLSGSYTANIRQNTVVIDATKSNYTYHYSYGLYVYMYYHSAVNVQGNIVDIKGNYYAYPCYTYNTTPANIKWDRNSYYVRNLSGGQYWYCPSGGVGSFTAWNSLGFAGANEKEGDPKWNNPATFDYKSNTLMNQNNIPYNALDIRDANNVTRNKAKNDRGALEGMLDIQSVSSNFAPNANECAGFVASPTITLKNNFLEAVTAFDMGMTVNGVLVSTTKVTASIAVGGTGTVTMNPYTFSKPGVQVVKYFLLDADDLPTNDTLTYTFNIKKAPGGGTLTLNTSASAPKAHFDITGKPDITTNGQRISYDLTPPASLGYGNGDYLGGFGGTNKWSASVSGKTASGINVPAGLFNIVAPTASSNLRVDFTPSLAFVDSMISITIKINDYILVCDTSYKRKILVAPQGVPNFKIPTIICDKDEVYFENTSTVTSGALLSSWKFSSSPSAPTSDATSPVYMFPGPGTYDVTLTVITSPYGYETSITKQIMVNEIPTANFKPTNACEGVNIKLTNTTFIGSGTLSYVWDFGDGSATSTATHPTKLYAAPGGYKVTLTASGNGCKNVISKNVYQFARPKAVYTHTAGSCENDLFEFKNTSTISQGEFGNRWDFDDAGNKATIAEPQYDFLTPGVKKVKLVAISEFGCADSMTQNITVKAVSKSGFTYPFACSRTLTPFTNTTVVPTGESVKTTTWDFGDGFTSAASNPLKQWFSIGPKIVKLSTELNNGCKDEVSQILTVGVQPLVNFQFADQCAGSEVQYTNLTSFTQGKITYDWDFGDLNHSNEASPRHSYTTGLGTQSFTVKLKASIAGGCADSLIKIININPLPTTCNFDIARDYNTSLTAYKYTPTGGTLSGIKYTWLTGDGNTVSSTGAGTAYSYSATGKYCVTMIAENASGCECTQTKCITLNTGVNSAESFNKLITIFPNPTNGVFSVNLDAFVSNEMTINVYNAVGALVKTVTVNTNTANIDLSEFANGVYVVKVIADNQVATQKITLNK